MKRVVLFYFIFALHPYIRSQNVNVLYDDFNGSAINTDFWYTDPRVFNGDRKHELDLVGGCIHPYCYVGSMGCSMASNVIVSGNYCELKATTDDVSDCFTEGGFQDKLFSQGFIVSKRKYKYGAFEAKIKMDIGDGLWPAFWLYGCDNPGSGVCTEIDMFEINTHWNDRFTNNTHYVVGTSDFQNLYHYDMNGDIPSFVTCMNSIDVGGTIDQWHTYKVIWKPGYLEYYFDGNFIRAVDFLPWAPDFDIGMHIVLNNSIHSGNEEPGSGLGYCSGYLATGHPFSTSFPKSMYIDYVSVNAFEECGDVGYCNYDQTWGKGFTHITGQNITMGGIGCSIDLNVTNPDYAIDDLELIAKNEIILKPGFVSHSEPYITSGDGKNGGPSNFVARISSYDCITKSMDLQNETFIDSSKISDPKINLSNLIFIGPNPTSSSFTISMSPETLYQIKKVYITDVNGKKFTNLNLPAINTIIPFSENAGVYFVCFETEKEIAVKKLVKF